MRLSLESKRAFFRAQVIALAGEETHVTKGPLLAALFVSPPFVYACERTGCPITHLIHEFHVSESLRQLEDAAILLASKGIEFGSRTHIDSLDGKLRPMSRDLLEVIHALDEKFANSDARVTVFDILEALSSHDTAVRATLSSSGLSITDLRTIVGDTLSAG